MLSYLEKFNNLPGELRDKVSSEKVTAAIAELEKKYNVSLAVAVMKVMVKEIAVRDLPQYFVFEYNLDRDQAEVLVEEMKKRVFVDVADYLGIAKEKKKKEEVESLEEWLEFKKKEAQRREAKFYFSPEDEEEVKEIAKKTEDLKPRISDEEYEEMLGKIINELRFNFSSEELHKRFRQVMNTYIKGIRNKIDTKQTLMKEITAGGLDLNDDLASRALVVADSIRDEYEKKLTEKKSEESQGEIVSKSLNMPTEAIDKQEDKKEISGQPETERKKEEIKKLQQAGVRDVEYDFNTLAGQKAEPTAKTTASASAAEKKAETSEKAEKKEELTVASNFGVDKSDLEAVNSRITGQETKTSTEGIKSAAVDLRKESLASKVKGIADSISQLEEKPVASMARGETAFSLTAQVRREQKIDGKVKIEDVKKAPKLTGPVDELKEMDLVNFRRLNPDPQVAAKKIKEKIEALEEEGGYARRLIGIRAWRQSPLNHLYLQIGQESIKQKKGVKDIIDRRRKNGENYLTLEEFNAIMELNRELRF